VDEISEVSQDIIRKDKRLNPYFFLFLGIIVVLIFILVFSNSSKTSKDDYKNSQNQKNADENSIFDKEFSIAKNDYLVIPTENSNIRIKLVQISEDMVSLLPDKEAAPYTINKSNTLLLDYNNDFLFDFELKVLNFKKEEAVFLLRKVKEVRLKEHAAFTVLKGELKEENLASSSESSTIALNQNQVNPSNISDFSIEVKNISQEQVVIWVVRQSKKDNDDMIKVAPNNSVAVEIIKNGTLALRAIDISNLASLEIKYGDKVEQYKDYVGEIGYLQFELKEVNGINKISWELLTQ
jgi:hypothetical protein